MLLLFMLLTCITVTAQQRFNGSFERLDSNANPINWDLTYYQQNKFDIKVDSLVKRQGKYAISISSNPNGQSSAIRYSLDKKYVGRSLKLIASIKTEEVTDGFAGIWIRVDGENDQLEVDMMEKQDLKGTNDWKDYLIEVPYDEGNAKSIHVGALLFGKGKMWVDDMRLYMDNIPIDEVKEATFPASFDMSYERSSKIDTLLNTSLNLKKLTLLGQYWGFLKYHHPAVAKGNYNWDAELFKIIPLVTKVADDKEFSTVLEKWVDNLGMVPKCKDCKMSYKSDSITQRPDYGDLFKNNVFSTTLKQKLKFILNNNNPTNYYVSFQGRSVPRFDHEKNYDHTLYPDAGIRLLALYRYWNIIQYFSPNRYLITEDWNKVLPALLPEFMQAENKTKYANAMVKLVSAIHDSHGFITSEAHSDFLGKYRLPFQIKYIEDQVVVTGFYNDSNQVKEHIKIGDILAGINGEKVTDLIQKFTPYVSASNPETIGREICSNYLTRSNNPKFKLEIIRDGKSMLIDQQAVDNSKVDAYAYEYGALKKGYKLLSPQIGYIVCNGFRVSDLDSIRMQLGNTKGIIVDMRSYPIDEMYDTLGSYFKSDSSTFVKFTNGSVQYPGLFTYSPLTGSGQKNEDYYKGKVVVLVNEMTQSNAEFVTMAFQSAHRTTVIGSATAGADGSVTSITLPGRFKTSFTGIGVHYPDGTNAQRVGVKIDHVVKPTIHGIKNGIDEVLEKAKALILED